MLLRSDSSNAQSTPGPLLVSFCMYVYIQAYIPRRLCVCAPSVSERVFVWVKKRRSSLPSRSACVCEREREDLSLGGGGGLRVCVCVRARELCSVVSPASPFSARPTPKLRLLSTQNTLSSTLSSLNHQNGSFTQHKERWRGGGGNLRPSLSPHHPEDTLALKVCHNNGARRGSILSSATFFFLTLPH